MRHSLYYMWWGKWSLEGNCQGDGFSSKIFGFPSKGLLFSSKILHVSIFFFLFCATWQNWLRACGGVQKENNGERQTWHLISISSLAHSYYCAKVLSTASAPHCAISNNEQSETHLSFVHKKKKQKPKAPKWMTYFNNWNINERHLRILRRNLTNCWVKFDYMRVLFVRYS